MIFLLCLMIFVLSLWLCAPIIKKPLSEDDGNWHYLAYFWSKGLRPYDGYMPSGFFSYQVIVAWVYKLYGKSISFFKCFKVFWYALTASMISLFSFVLWGDPLASILAGLIFSLAIMSPATLGILTYAEHFLLLPLTISIIFAMSIVKWGFLAALLSGIMAGLAFQIKITALIMLLLPLALCLVKGLLMSFGFGLGFVVVQLLPLFVLKSKSNNVELRNPRKDYLSTLVGPIVAKLRNVFVKLGFKFGIKCVSKIENLFGFVAGSYDGYVAHNLNQSSAELFDAILKNVKYIKQDMFLLIILAVVQLSAIAWHDLSSIYVGVLLVLGIVTYYIPRSFYTPHINIVWLPIALLAAKALSYIFWLSIEFVIALPFLFLVAWQFFLFAAKALKQCRSSERFTIGYWGPDLGILWAAAEDIGKYIQSVSNLNERLLVWGPQATVYLYANKEALSPYNLTTVYPSGEPAVNIFEILKVEEIPKWIVLYDCSLAKQTKIETLEDLYARKYKLRSELALEKNGLPICWQGKQAKVSVYYLEENEAEKLKKRIRKYLDKGRVNIALKLIEQEVVDEDLKRELNLEIEKINNVRT